MYAIRSYYAANAEGPDSSVSEHGLTSVPDTSETTTGSFTVSATDGIDQITVGGQDIGYAALAAAGSVPVTVDTGEGWLVIRNNFV